MTEIAPGSSTSAAVKQSTDRPLPSVSVIIPAHNEDRVIGACVKHLRQQDYPDLQIIFVLDRCTDRTRDILQQHADDDDRITIIENDSCPDDWAGKCNAVRVGVGHARGEYLLFADADTRFAPQLVRAAVITARREKADLFSLLSTLTFRKFYECIIQPVATLMLMHMFPIDRTNRTVRPRGFANGQFMLIRRDMYERIGGHEPVRQEIMEDIHLSRVINRAGGRTVVLPDDGLLRCSMYRSYREFRNGWQRIYTGSTGFSPARLMRYGLQIFYTGVIAPALAVAAIIVAVIGWQEGHRNAPVLLVALVSAMLVAQAATLWKIYTTGGAPRWAIWLFPIGAWVTAMMFFTAANNLRRRHAIVWGGRQYHGSPHPAREKP